MFSNLDITKVWAAAIAVLEHESLHTCKEMENKYELLLLSGRQCKFYDRSLFSNALVVNIFRIVINVTNDLNNIDLAF